MKKWKNNLWERLKLAILYGENRVGLSADDAMICLLCDPRSEECWTN